MVERGRRLSAAVHGQFLPKDATPGDILSWTAMGRRHRLATVADRGGNAAVVASGEILPVVAAEELTSAGGRAPRRLLRLRPPSSPPPRRSDRAQPHRALFPRSFLCLAAIAALHHRLATAARSTPISMARDRAFRGDSLLAAIVWHHAFRGGRSFGRRRRDISWRMGRRSDAGTAGKVEAVETDEVARRSRHARRGCRREEGRERNKGESYTRHVGPTTSRLSTGQQHHADESPKKPPRKVICSGFQRRRRHYT